MRGVEVIDHTKRGDLLSFRLLGQVAESSAGLSGVHGITLASVSPPRGRSDWRDIAHRALTPVSEK